jgi:hypothetical protein
MAISVHPIDFIIHVLQADLTPISGTLYELDTDWFRLQLKDWEADGGQTGGATFQKTHNHNTEVEIAGVTYIRAINILAPYSVEFEDGQYTVILSGSNNNIFDVGNGFLIQNQVQIISTNSAGLQTVVSGSGVTEQDKTDIVEGVWDELLTGATHNIPASSGRRLRQLGDIVSGEVTDPGATADSFITDLTEARDAFYIDQLIRFTTGNLAGYVRPISAYDGATKTVTVTETMIEAPDNGSEFDIIPTHVHPIEEIAEGVWADTTAQTVETMLAELHKLQGLLAGKPMTVTPDSRTVDDIDLDITGDGEISTTVTRQ